MFDFEGFERREMALQNNAQEDADNINAQIVAEARIPFEISIEKPNRATIDAIEEVELMERNPELYKGYATAEEMMQDILG